MMLDQSMTQAMMCGLEYVLERHSIMVQESTPHLESSLMRGIRLSGIVPSGISLGPG